MAGALATLALALAMGSAGSSPHHAHHAHPGPYHSHYAHPGRILPPGPDNGWGFPNGNPDGIGWYEVGASLPLGADRTPEYYFRRYHALPAEQLFLPSYYNAYVTRGQRYLPYVGCGGWHPAGGPPPALAELPVHPYVDSGEEPVVPVPSFSGRVEATPINPGSSGLAP